MRKRLIPLALLMLICAGCAKQVSAPVPGSLNAFDATSYRTLMDAQAAIDSVKADVAKGVIVLGPTQKNVLNQAIADYNTAQASWHVYHSGATADTVGLTNAINQLVADVANIVTQIRGGK